VDVWIRNFDVAMNVKNKGIEFGVWNTGGDHLGDLVVTKTKLIWCKGRTRPENGVTISWKKFIKFMEQRKN